MEDVYFSNAVGIPLQSTQSSVYAIWTEAAAVVPTEQITARSRRIGRQTRTYMHRDRQTDRCILHSCSCFSLLLKIHCSYFIQNRKSKRFKATQLAWDKFISVCKCGQIFPRAQRCHYLQPGKSPDNKLYILLLTYRKLREVFYLNGA